jgi:hypothetical protein
VKTTPNNEPSSISVIYHAILAPILKLMDKMSGRDAAFNRK